MHKAVLITLFLAATSFALNCTPRMARTAMVGAALIGTAALVTEQTAHFHHINCGCPRHHEDGRWVYHYEGGSEYYDSEAGVWYHY